MDSWFDGGKFGYDSGVWVALGPPRPACRRRPGQGDRGRGPVLAGMRRPHRRPRLEVLEDRVEWPRSCPGGTRPLEAFAA